LYYFWSSKTNKFLDPGTKPNCNMARFLPYYIVIPLGLTLTDPVLLPVTVRIRERRTKYSLHPASSIQHPQHPGRNDQRPLRTAVELYVLDNSSAIQSALST